VCCVYFHFQFQIQIFIFVNHWVLIQTFPQTIIISDSPFFFPSNFLKRYSRSNLPPPWRPPEHVSSPPRSSAVSRRLLPGNRAPTGSRVRLRDSPCRWTEFRHRRQRWRAEKETVRWWERSVWKRRRRRRIDAWTVGRSIWSNRRSW